MFKNVFCTSPCIIISLSRPVIAVFSDTHRRIYRIDDNVVPPVYTDDVETRRECDGPGEGRRNGIRNAPDDDVRYNMRVRIPLDPSRDPNQSSRSLARLSVRPSHRRRRRRRRRPPCCVCVCRVRCVWCCRRTNGTNDKRYYYRFPIARSPRRT